MNDEFYLRAMIADPTDAAVRGTYADWLESRGDPRARLLRHDWNTNRTREDIEALRGIVDPQWLATIDTLGRPFRPFFFWNNTGPRAYKQNELPLNEQIGTRGPLLTFESSFRGDQGQSPGLYEDLAFLYHLRLGDCYYGAATCPIHPFLCELPEFEGSYHASDVLRALKASNFRSEHIRNLEVTAVAYPGYDAWSINDEIHNDITKQFLFVRPGHMEDRSIQDYERDQRTHESLRDRVSNRKLWYVLLHNWLPGPEIDRGMWVVLFAVGRSVRGNRLIGVVSHQMCHNLCD